jgi:2-furoyl-CoA dehydrogenase large subunit
VLSQVVADVFGLLPSDIRVVTELDTAKDAWSIASGNYSSRFAPAVAGTAQLAAEALRGKLARIAASQLNVTAEDLVFAGGKIFSRRNPESSLPFGRVASTSHWAPGTVPEEVGTAIRETAFWTPPELTAPDEADMVNSSLCHGFIFDVCGVEIDKLSGQARIDRYVTMHDCGTMLHPGMVAGQVQGGFVQALGAVFLEELAYSDDGAFITGNLADYLLPTATEVPALTILHVETPSPFTRLGAKGVGEGNCMSTPVCIANAVADALGGFRVDVDAARERADIVLARPPMNTISMPQRDQLRQAFEALDEDERVRVIVLRAEGEHFSSGGYIRDFWRRRLSMCRGWHGTSRRRRVVRSR